MKKRLRKKNIIKNLEKHGIIYDDICINVNKGKPCDNVITINYNNHCMLNDNRYRKSCYITECPTNCPYQKKLKKFAKKMQMRHITNVLNFILMEENK